MSRWPVALLVLAFGSLWGPPAGAQDYPASPPPDFPQSDPDAPQDRPSDQATDAAPAPNEYEDALRPYGAWQDDSQYGRFWRPGVSADWQPYSDGRWTWTSAGWTWASYEPWSWTFHYGRWSYLPAWGWSWFPGSTWGPAWVQWSTYGGYVGWAPLSPSGAPPIDRFVFVRDHDFCAPRLRGRLVPYRRAPWNVRQHWRDHSGWPDRHRIERVSRHPVRVLPDRPRESLAPWQREDRRRPGASAPPIDDRHRPRDARDPGRWPPGGTPPRQPFAPGGRDRRSADRRPERDGVSPGEGRRPQPAERAPGARPGGDRHWSGDRGRFASDRAPAPRIDGRAAPRDARGPARAGEGRARPGQGGRGGHGGMSVR